jgi:hypothetical protein
MRKRIRELPVRQRGTGLTCIDRIRAEEVLETALLAHVVVPVRNKYYRRIRNIDTDECR